LIAESIVRAKVRPEVHPFRREHYLYCNHVEGRRKFSRPSWPGQEKERKLPTERSIWSTHQTDIGTRSSVSLSVASEASWLGQYVNLSWTRRLSNYLTQTVVSDSLSFLGRLARTRATPYLCSHLRFHRCRWSGVINRTVGTDQRTNPDCLEADGSYHTSCRRYLYALLPPVRHCHPLPAFGTAPFAFLASSPLSLSPHCSFMEQADKHPRCDGQVFRSEFGQQDYPPAALVGSDMF